MDNINKLYLRFTSKVSDIHRLDDISLYLSNEEEVASIDLSQAVEDEPEEEVVTPDALDVSISDLNQLALDVVTDAVILDPTVSTVSYTSTLIDDTFLESISGFTAGDNIKLTGVVVNDPAGENFVSNSLIISTKGSTEEYNGISIVGSKASIYTHELQVGDEVEVTLMNGYAKIVNIEGTIRVIGSDSDDWVYVKKISEGNTITPVTLSAADANVTDALKPYQGMLVKVEGVAPADDVILGNNTNASNIELRTTDGSVYCYAIKSKNAVLYNVTLPGRELTEAAAIQGIAYKAYDVSIDLDTEERYLVYSQYSVAPRNLDDLGDLYVTDYDMRTITIPELYALADGLAASESMYVDETMDRTLKAVITTDCSSGGVAGNYTFKSTHIATLGGVDAPYNGILISGSDPVNLSMYRGEIYEFTLQMGKTKIQKDAYGYIQLYSDQNSPTITRVNTGLTEDTPAITIKSTEMSTHIGQVVTIKDASTTSTGIWGTYSNTNTQLSDYYGTFYVYVSNKAKNLYTSYVASTNNISGVPGIISGIAKLQIRDVDDVAGYESPNSGSGEEPEDDFTSIPDLVTLGAAAGTTATAIGTTEDIMFEAVVNSCQNGYDNHLYGYLALQSDNATMSGNGIYLHQVVPTSYSRSMGDKVLVTIPKGTAEIIQVNGMNVIRPLGSDGSSSKAKDAGITVTQNGDATQTPIVIGADADLSLYQGMVVTVKDVTLAEGGDNLISTTAHVHLALTNGENTVNAFFKKGCSIIAFQVPYYATTGDVTGCVYYDTDAWVIAPRTADDFADFMTEPGTTDPEPEPDADTDATTISIPDFYALDAVVNAGTTAAVISADTDYIIEGVITTEYAAGNVLNKYVTIQTEGATTEYNGLSVSGYSTGNLGTLSLNFGDKVTVKLPKGQATILKNSDGAYVIGGIDYQGTTDKTEEYLVAGDPTTITPIDVTSLINAATDLSTYQAMYVKVLNATSTTSGGSWADTASGSTMTFVEMTTADGKEFNVWIKGMAAGFKSVAYVAATGDVQGTVTLSKALVGIAPQSLDDVASFNAD